jgi:hypothetical protein
MSVFADILITETLLSPTQQLYKTAGFLDDFTATIKSYFGSKIDKDNPVPSVINLLAPAVLWKALSAIGFGGTGMLLGFLINVFDINVVELLTPLCEEVKSLVKSGKPISSSQISNITNQNTQVDETDQDAGEANFSSAELIHHAKILKLAIIDFETQNLRLMKEDFNYHQSNLYKMAANPALKAKSTRLLMKIIGFIITTILAAAGLLVAGDVVRSIFHESPAHQSSPSSASTTPLSTQTKFTSKGDSALPSAIQMINTPENIEQMLIQFAKDTYNDLDGKESSITNSSNFQTIKDQIVWFNSHHPNSSIISLPSQYSSKKQLVEHFIDQVASA